MSYYDRKEISNSDLSWLKNQLSGKPQNDPTEAYKFGSLIDCMITEPEKVDYFKFTCNGESYTPEQFDQAEKMKKSFYRDELCAGMVKMAEPQKMMVKEDLLFHYGGFDFNLNVRCKWDLWIPKFNYGGDIKSTTATTQAQFESAIKFFDYDRQRAFYMKLAGSKQDILIGISKVNFQVFKVPIKFGDRLHSAGVAKYEYLAFQWFKMFGNDKNV
jgi:hypothetical protein